MTCSSQMHDVRCFSDRYAALTREGDGEKAKARLDRSRDNMSVTFYFSDKSPRVQSHASSKWNLFAGYFMQKVTVTHLLFIYLFSLINPINTNVDKIFHFVFIQTGPVQFWHSNSWFYLHMLLICYYNYSYEHFFTIPLPNFHVNHYWFLK